MGAKGSLPAGVLPEYCLRMAWEWHLKRVYHCNTQAIPLHCPGNPAATPLPVRYNTTASTPGFPGAYFPFSYKLLTNRYFPEPACTTT